MAVVSFLSFLLFLYGFVRNETAHTVTAWAVVGIL